jgi:hypothetical protein
MKSPRPLSTPQGLQLNKIVAHSELHEFAEAREVHLVHDVVAMAFDRASGNAERISNGFVAFAFCQQLNNFDFPRR